MNMDTVKDLFSSIGDFIIKYEFTSFLVAMILIAILALITKKKIFIGNRVFSAILAIATLVKIIFLYFAPEGSTGVMSLIGHITIDPIDKLVENYFASITSQGSRIFTSLIMIALSMIFIRIIINGFQKTETKIDDVLSTVIISVIILAVMKSLVILRDALLEYVPMYASSQTVKLMALLFIVIVYYITQNWILKSRK